MLAKDGEIESTGVLVKIGGEWTFQLEMDDGTIVRCDQSWPTQGEANAMMRRWIEDNGGRHTPVQ